MKDIKVMHSGSQGTMKSATFAAEWSIRSKVLLNRCTERVAALVYT